VEDPRVALQCHPKTLSEAFSDMLELESYLVGAIAQDTQESTIDSIQLNLVAMLNGLMEDLRNWNVIYMRDK